MLIRKNTKAFKTIRQIITDCHDRPERTNWIRLYITKAGHTIADRVSTEGIPGDADLFYTMTYDTVLTNLDSADRQLYESDDVPGMYFFHTSSNKVWDETPFEFDLKIKEVFAALPDLPAVRKKEKVTKYVFPVTKVAREVRPDKKEKVTAPTPVKVIPKGPRQPDYQLKHPIEFTELDRVVFKQPEASKKDVLDYYHKMAAVILPYLKDRPLSLGILLNGKRKQYTSLDQLEEEVSLPDWIRRSMGTKKNNTEPFILCHDKEHLLWYAEIGCIEFSCRLSRITSLSFPDYIVIEIEAAENKSGQLFTVLQIARKMLTGMQLPSFVKTDGKSGFHVFIPFDSKSDFDITKATARYICQLVRLTLHDVAAVEGEEENSYGKVTLSYLINSPGEHIVAPYSLVINDEPTLSVPVPWDELEEGSEWQKMDEQFLLKRIKQEGDCFATLFKKKVNADELLQRFDKHYSFLLQK